MVEAEGEKKFEARLPLPLWEAYEAWARDRGPIPNKLLLTGLLRLFLEVPDPIKQAALIGRDQDISRFLAPLFDAEAAAVVEAAEAQTRARSKRQSHKRKAL